MLGTYELSNNLNRFTCLFGYFIIAIIIDGIVMYLEVYF